jgi:hypothetical protein
LHRKINSSLPTLYSVLVERKKCDEFYEIIEVNCGVHVDLRKKLLSVLPDILKENDQINADTTLIVSYLVN